MKEPHLQATYLWMHHLSSSRNSSQMQALLLRNVGSDRSAQCRTLRHQNALRLLLETSTRLKKITRMPTFSLKIKLPSPRHVKHLTNKYFRKITSELTLHLELIVLLRGGQTKTWKWKQEETILTLLSSLETSLSLLEKKKYVHISLSVAKQKMLGLSETQRLSQARELDILCSLRKTHAEAQLIT